MKGVYQASNLNMDIKQVFNYSFSLTIKRTLLEKQCTEEIRCISVGHRQGQQLSVLMRKIVSNTLSIYGCLVLNSVYMQKVCKEQSDKVSLHTSPAKYSVEDWWRNEAA
mmetsp:Transcript_56334/g.119774  ORF Transcript_56334/g.119774 Transcript_56334/m.119774 type:complete len:109 (+) Transcript_56334:50-376(+)